MKQKTKQSRGGLGFFIIMLIIYLITFFLHSEKTINAAEYSGKLLLQIVPILLLVFVLLFIINFFVNPGWVKKHLGKESGKKGWLIASVGGVLSVGSIYPWYALLKDFKDKGMRPALIAVFLYSRGIKLPLLPLLVHYFGLGYTLLLAAYMLTFSLLGGVVMEKILPSSEK